MLCARFHPIRWNTPDLVLKIDLVPGGASGFSGTRRRKDQKPEAKLDCQRGLRCFNDFERLTDFLIGKRPEMGFELRHTRQCAVNGFTRWIDFKEAMSHCPSKHGSHSLAHPAGRLWLSCPNRGEDFEHCPAVDMIDGRAAQSRHGVSFERLDPACNVPSVAPARFVGLVDNVSGFLKRRNARLLLLSQRIATLSYCGPVLQCQFTSLGEAYGRECTQTNISTPSRDYNALDP